MEIIEDRLWSTWKEINTTSPKLYKNSPWINWSTEFCSIFQNFLEEDCILLWSIPTAWRSTHDNLSDNEENAECQGTDVNRFLHTWNMCAYDKSGMLVRVSCAPWVRQRSYSPMLSGLFYVKLNFKADTGVFKLMQCTLTLVYFFKRQPENQ